jgi:anti-sigma factor RsiW
MNITRDVITDLLPLYLAGEASAGTRSLLEEYLRQNPEFAAEVREHVEKSTALLSAVPISPPSNHEKTTFERIRRFNRSRQQLLAFAVAFTLMPFAFVFENGHISWVMMRDNPRQAILFMMSALACWIAYQVLGRRLRSEE